MSTTALFKTAQGWKQLKCLSMDKWVKMDLYMRNVLFTWDVIQHVKKGQLAFATAQMELEGKMLSEIRQTGTRKHCVISFTFGFCKSQIHGSKE